ncbi:DUF4037 domain-containing protein [Desulfotalea psychrophila]|uniref:Related to TPR-repeat-containing proteins (Partial length) n=1 Tax=Desulfotalea psychrophila (strain LSv54 / DSM 12343) TaxID=177439 RepID=Q6AQQ9_DESPS|nr:DUF4037 domain-containing protein [Desulfotalea psychrophila]CAG35314.1 related to TPR-repeat-containing proteins (partial length) [Desulfotalea psychrophila LSv54]
MDGLILSRKYYEECGRDVLYDRFGVLMDRVAVGLVGPGSECLGFDDQFSRDHDWGPSFCLWLTDEDFALHGEALQAVYCQLPQSFAGFSPRQVSQGEDGRVGAMSISSFYRRYTGLTAPPRTLGQWNIPSSHLSLCTNGEVFVDPLGTFTAWRDALLAYYPEDIRLKMVADGCMRAGQAGQYNWQRGIMRSDPYVMAHAKVQFCTEAMQLIYLLNRAYAPYFKWLLRGLERLPLLGVEVAPLLRDLLCSNAEMTGGEDTWVCQQNIIERICQRLILEFYEQGLIREKTPFLLDQVPLILAGIEDAEFRAGFWGGR